MLPVVCCQLYEDHVDVRQRPSGWDHVIATCAMYGYHLDGPLEPLTPTSSPQPHYASSPFPSPIRRMVLKRRRPGREPPPIQKHRVVQVHHWHLSEAQRQSTGYRGCSSKLCEHIIDFSKDASSAERLSALLDAGYRLVRYDE